MRYRQSVSTRDFSLSDHVSFYRATDSRDYPGLVAANRLAAMEPAMTRNLQLLANTLIEEILIGASTWFRVPVDIRIHSMFRSIQLNAAVGGSERSQHRLGQACDFHLVNARTGTRLDTLQVFAWIVRQLSEPWHQCYADLRGDFIHIASPTGNSDGQWWIVTPAGTKIKELPT
jgi:hypothetical protein